VSKSKGTERQSKMGLWNFLTGGYYGDGYDAAQEWKRLSGGASASDDDIDDIVGDDAYQEDADEFHAGWRNSEKEEGHGFLWRAFFGT
jgi:hypothetical protein